MSQMKVEPPLIGAYLALEEAVEREARLDNDGPLERTLVGDPSDGILGSEGALFLGALLWR